MNGDLDSELEKNINAYLTLGSEPCDAEPWRVRRRFSTASAEIREALQAFGFYSPTVVKKLSWDDECWQATFQVDPGQPVLFREISLKISGDAAEDKAFKKIIATSGLVKGEPLSHEAYKSTKQKMQSLAADRGYFDAEFDAAVLDVWLEDFAADVTLHFDSGKRYRFGEITIVQDILEPDLVSRYVTVSRGEPYLSSKLTVIRQSLQASGYFSEIIIRPDFKSNEAHETSVEIKLTPAKRISLSVGGGYSTDTGPRVRMGVENRRVNEQGHQFSSGLQASKVLKEVSASYRLPLSDPEVEWLSFSAGFQAEDTDTSKSDKTVLGVKRARKRSGDWIWTDGLQLQFDRYEVGLERDSSRLLIPSIGLSRKRANRPINPDSGHRLSFELRGASEAAFSTTSFLQFVTAAKMIYPLSEDQRLLLRADAGTTLKKRFGELPPSVRFFAGGLESVRGYGYKELGPTNDADLVIGGSHIVTASVEYERRFYRDFSYAAFIDAGNAFDSSINARVGVGMGLKWRSPIGPIRVYLAHPLNYSDDNIRLHIRIGPDL